MTVSTVRTLSSPFARIAPVALVLVVITLGVTGVLAAVTIRASADHARHAAKLHRAYQDATDAVREQDFWVTEHLVRLAAPEEDLPAAKLRAEHARATRDVLAAMARVRRLG